MKISFVEPHLRVYGGIRRIIEFSNRLAGRGHDVTIFHSDGAPCDWMPCNAKVKPGRAVLNETHDAVIYNDPSLEDVSFVSGADARLKVFYVLELYQKEVLKGFNPRLLLPRNQRMRLLRRSLRSPYLKLANATWEKEWLKRHMGIDAELLFGGINTDLFRPAEGGQSGGGFRLLASGDPRPRKGMSTIEDAVEIVRRTHPNVELTTYHGKGIPQHEMAATYCAADVFVEASWHAGWNNPVAEAMACGVPVVCTDIGGVADFAFDGKTALLVPPQDSRAMASAISRMIEDGAFAKSLADTALAHILTFRWEESVTRLEQILESHL